MLWDSDFTLLFVIWATAVISEPEQGTEPGLCCNRLKELEEQLLSQSDSKSWGFPPDLSCSKAATAALCHSTPSSFGQRCPKWGRSGISPPFIMISDWGGFPELSQLLSSIFSLLLSPTIFSALLAFQHIWISKISLCPYFSPWFLSEIFPTLLSAAPISASLLFLCPSCKWFAWWFLLSCFYQAFSSNIPAFAHFCPRFCLPSLSALGPHVLGLLDFS